MLLFWPLPISIVEEFNCLATLPFRLSLLGERRSPLASVLRGEERSRDLALALPELVLRPAVPLLHHLLGGRERERAVRGDRAGELERRLQCAAVVGNSVDQPELVAALRRDRVARQSELHRRALGNPAREPQERAARGHERPLHLRDAELRRAAGHDQVAGERHLEPAGHGEPLDRRDQRLARRALRDAGEPAVAHIRRLALHEGLQVHARAEASAGPGEHSDAEAVGGVEVVERAGDALGKRAVHRVAGVGTVEGDDLDAAVALDENGRGLLGICSHAANANVTGVIRTETTTLDTGLPLIRLHMDGTRAVTALVAFDAGARTELPEENGMPHCLEHLVFKGGEEYSTYRDVNETAERLGAQLNAYTSHDVVAFHITCRAEALMPAVDLLTDFVAKARIDAGELDRERGVVIQEIHRSDDVPSSVADKLLDTAIYGDHPLGRPVLGPAAHIQTFERDAILATRASLAVYATLLGGSMGSRLFDEIREQRGLCYAIRSYGWSHTDTSTLEVSAGLDSTKLDEAYARIREIVEELATDGPRDGEVERARAYAAGSTVLSLESTGAVARRAAGQKVTFGEIKSPDETIDALDAVTEDDVRDIARNVHGAPVVACVGPHEVGDFD